MINRQLESKKRRFEAELNRQRHVEEETRRRLLLQGIPPSQDLPAREAHAAYWEFMCREYYPNDPRTQRAFKRAIKTRQTIGIIVKGHRAMYDGSWGFLSCNDIFVNGLQLPSPAVFVLADLDPVAMQEIYFHWQMPIDPGAPEPAIKDWMHRRRQTFTDLLPFAFVHWQRKHTGHGDPYYEQLGTLRKDFRSRLTVQQALAECQHFPEEEQAVA